LLYYVCIAVLTLDAGLLARSQYPEGPATGHLDTGFSWFPSVYKRMLRWFPSFQVATTCLACSPPDLNFLVTFFFKYLCTCKITTATGWHPIAVNKYYYLVEGEIIRLHARWGWIRAVQIRGMYHELGAQITQYCHCATNRTTGVRFSVETEAPPLRDHGQRDWYRSTLPVLGYRVLFPGGKAVWA